MGADCRVPASAPVPYVCCRSVAEATEVDLNMRVGLHTGRVLCGGPGPSEVAEGCVVQRCDLHTRPWEAAACLGKSGTQRAGAGDSTWPMGSLAILAPINNWRGLCWAYSDSWPSRRAGKLTGGGGDWKAWCLPGWELSRVLTVGFSFHFLSQTYTVESVVV